MPLARMVRNLLRSQEIMTVFFRHGFGDMLHRMGLDRYLPSTREDTEAGKDKPELKSAPRHFREALEELGGGFIKLGQLLSTRPDILPATWIDELVRLQDEVSPIDFEIFKAQLERELGPVENNYHSIETMPLAAGSIAQVHRGITRQNDEVVIKVRKPGVKRTILKDCEILEAVVELLEKHVPESRGYRPVDLVRQFREAVTEELDFNTEAQNLDRFRADFEGYPSFMFPEVYWDLTTERVLTMEMVDGIKVSLVEKLAAAHIEGSVIARILAEGILRQVLEFGFFHADPHPGNIVVVGERTVCFFDCGLVGRLDEGMRENLVLLLGAGVRKDTRAIADIFLDMDALPEDFDRITFLKEAHLFLERYYRVPLKRLRIRLIVDDIIRLVRRFNIRIPPDLLLVGKALITLEGLGRKLDPEFDAVAVAQPFVNEIVLSTYGPRYVGRKLFQGSYDVLRLIRDLPSDLRELLHTLRDNQLRVVVDHRGLKEAFQEINRASKRISVSIINAAIVIASAVIVLAGKGPEIFGIPALGLAGFAIAAVMGIWMLVVTRMKNKP